MLLVMIFIHLRFRETTEFKEEVLVFHREKVKVSDVLKRMSYLNIEGGIMRLYNEHGRLMKHSDVVDKARVYTLLRGRRF